MHRTSAPALPEVTTATFKSLQEPSDIFSSYVIRREIGRVPEELALSLQFLDSSNVFFHWSKPKKEPSCREVPSAGICPFIPYNAGLNYLPVASRRSARRFEEDQKIPSETGAVEAGTSGGRSFCGRDLGRLSHLRMSDLEQRRLLKRLDACLKRPENQLCADCPSRQPRWASVNLGIFICTNCSGIHRSLGVHISFVRSTTLDTWKEKQVVDMETMGNDRANAYWEARLPPGAKPTSSALPVVEKYIRAKYERKMYADSTRDGPTRGDGSGGSVASAPAVAPAVAPAAAPAAAPVGGGLVDLLDVAPAPAPAPAATNGGWGAFGTSAPAAPAANGGWDAFGAAAPASAPQTATGNWDAFGTSAPAPTAPSPAPPAAAGGWDAFGTSEPAPAAPAAPAATGGWDAFVSAPPAAASTPQAATTAPAAADDWGAFTDASAAAAPAPKPQVSKDDIMNLFNTPQGGGMRSMPHMGGMQQPNGMTGGMGVSHQQQMAGMGMPHQQQMAGMGMPHQQQMAGMMPQTGGMMPQMGGMMPQTGGVMNGGQGMMPPQMGGMPLDIMPDTTYTPSEKKKPEPQHHAAFDQFKMF